MFCMQKLLLCLLAVTSLLPAQDKSLSRHLIGTRSPLTAESSRAARDIAHEYTEQQASAVGLGSKDLESLYVDREYTDAHNGVTHIVYKQRFQGIDVYNAAWSVNINSSGQILNAGGELFGSPLLEPPGIQNASKAARAALAAVNPKLAEGFQGVVSRRMPSLQGSVRFARGETGQDMDGKMVWYGLRGTLQPAWVFSVTDEDGVSSYASVVDDETGISLQKRATTFFQSAAGPKGQVYERDSPQPNPKPGVLLTEAAPLVDRTVQSFVGDPAASPLGWVKGNETAGNNAVVGENPLGVSFLENPTITTTKDGNFSFPIQLGAGMPATTEFTDAVNTNLFYWVNKAHDLHFLSGFTEAAGNFQADNFGRGGVGGDPIYAYTHYGTQALSRATTRNAFFSTRVLADGSFPMIAMYLSHTGSGGFYTDGALDSTIIVHEYTHGVSFRLLSNGYSTFQEASMGEAWSDFYGLEYTLPDGAPADGDYTGGEYFLGTWGKSSPFRTRPFSTNLKVNSLTFNDLGSVIPFPEVHADGEIWMAAMWDMRSNLIKQFGEKEGRRRARVLVLDGMKFMPPFSTMIDARDAILLADRADYKGASQDQIWAAFAKRGMGATAYSFSGDSVHIAASFDLPSNKAKVVFHEQETTVGENLRVLVSDNNNPSAAVSVQLTSSSGDVETISLRRVGSVFVGSISTSANIVIKENGTLNLMPGDFASVYYTDFNTGTGAEQFTSTIPVRPGYFVTTTAPAFDTSGTEVPVVSGQRIELPFEFRFFEKSYRGIFVDKNGLLYFGDTLTDSCTDIPTLRSIPAIAPFWGQLAVTGTAQPREGIYYSRPNANSVRFRWAGETLTNFAVGAPVNFSVTLSTDNSILFNYGSGNTDLQNVGKIYGCFGPIGTGGIMTVGISSGHDTFAQGNFTQQSWTNAPGFRFDPPFGPTSFPRVTIESPKPEDRVQDVLTVSGIAYDTDTFFSRSFIIIDGVQYGSTANNVVRTDFCAQQNVRGCPGVGFRLNVLTNNLAPGKHTLQIRGLNARGAYTDSPAQPISFTVDPGQGRLPFGKVELPLAGAEVSGNLTIRGYAAINDLRILSVDTLIDGITFGPTTYNIARADICGTLAPVPMNCPAIGFQLVINTRTGTPPLQDGDHIMQIRVRDETGRLTILPDSKVAFKLKNGTVDFPKGAITSHKAGDTVTGTVQIAGYAYSQTGTIRNVIVIYDNLFADLARYGTPSAEVCAGLPGVAACPNIGWTFDFDTRRLSNGNHVLTVQITDSAGIITTLPSVGQPTISITVKN